MKRYRWQRYLSKSWRFYQICSFWGRYSARIHLTCKNLGYILPRVMIISKGQRAITNASKRCQQLWAGKRTISTFSRDIPTRSLTQYQIEQVATMCNDAGSAEVGYRVLMSKWWRGNQTRVRWYPPAKRLPPQTPCPFSIPSSTHNFICFRYFLLFRTRLSSIWDVRTRQTTALNGTHVSKRSDFRIRHQSRPF